MSMTTMDPQGSAPLRASMGKVANTDALLSALKLASWMGLEMWVRDVEGTNYRVNAPVIIGNDFVQFATGNSLRPIAVPLHDIAAFELP